MDLKEICKPLEQAAAPHMQRVNDAAKFLHDNTPINGSFAHEAFSGVAAGIVVCHALSKHSGWWQNPDGSPVDPNDPQGFGTKIALIHSEISEAMEGGRKNLMDSHLPSRKAEEVELADALIRIFDLAGARGLDLAGAMVEKLAYNQQRADHKLESRAGANGKVF